jgi:signal transduction histidine kinase
MEFAKTASQVAHDIRSPLVSLSLVLKNLPDLKDNYRKIINGSIQEISDIAENILEKHRVSSKKIVCIKPLLESIYIEKREEHSNRNINFVLDVKDQLRCWIKPVDFRRVISNLINNAVNSITDYGTITISAKNEINNVHITIDDTGCGIPHQILDSLENGTDYHTKGNGLGLRHAIQCIKEWNGSYTISSKECVGTSFCIILQRQVMN